MRPRKDGDSGSGDLFRARLDQIINMRHELVRLGSEIDWDWIDEELSGLYGDKGRPAVPTRFMVGLLFLKHIYHLSDEGVCERWVHDPYFQQFTGEQFFRHELPHERSGMRVVSRIFRFFIFGWRPDPVRRSFLSLSVVSYSGIVWLTIWSPRCGAVWRLPGSAHFHHRVTLPPREFACGCPA